MTQRQFAPAGQSLIGTDQSSPDGETWHERALFDVPPEQLAELLSRFKRGELTAAGDLPESVPPAVARWATLDPKELNALQRFVLALVRHGVKLLMYRAWRVFVRWTEHLSPESIAQIEQVEQIRPDVIYDPDKEVPESDRLKVNPR